jgi:hypothetical protein
MYIVYTVASLIARDRPSDRFFNGVRLQFVGTRATSQGARVLAERESKRVRSYAAIALSTEPHTGWSAVYQDGSALSRDEIERVEGAQIEQEIERERCTICEQPYAEHNGQELHRFTTRAGARHG